MADDELPEIPEDDVEMGFFQHLAELRLRLIRAMWGMIPGVVIGGVFHTEILELELRPLYLAWRELGREGEPPILSTNPTDIIVVYMLNAITIGVILGSPWVFWQLWQFVSPGLYRREKRLALPFVLASTLFFMGGIAFGYFVVFPLIFVYFLDMPTPESIDFKLEYMISEIHSFTLKLLVAFGVVFEIPVVISFLSAAGIVTWKGLLKFSRWWLLIAAILSALLTPPDPGSQLMMLGPLVALYFMSIVFAWFFGRKKPTERL